MEDYLFTSESVSEGHPDKVSDQISDAILDACLKQDPNSRVAVETLVTKNYVVIAGEVTTQAKVNYETLAREKIEEIGYTVPDIGFSASEVDIEVRISGQSDDICQGVTEGSGRFEEQGAGDQGMMFGYACDETAELMPAPIYYAHKILEGMASARHKNTTPFLPDSKSQVTVFYKSGVPVYIPTIVVSTQHLDGESDEGIEAAVREFGLSSIPKKLLSRRGAKTEVLINPTGRFVHGGPAADTGLTGRKIIVDTYGGVGRHGGGAFSGKDPSKVDRSAAYYGRYVAKNVVAAGLASKCEIQVAYAIGVAKPVGIYVDTFGTAKNGKSDREIQNAVTKVFDFRPKSMIDQLGLLNPIYAETAKYGHFGRTPENGLFPWEKTDKVDDLISAMSDAS